ncbi:hypothetical protein MKW94_007271 [Papaver nudicaule]|uniref:Uncharacterized protein n=1 Tax=Papaver nudicaule TaxID=74823 RepID=A0AA41VRE6_PAPNU|nr:hypothetical protein [Papaver nudicaule]
MLSTDKVFKSLLLKWFLLMFALVALFALVISFTDVSNQFHSFRIYSDCNQVIQNSQITKQQLEAEDLSIKLKEREEELLFKKKQEEEDVFFKKKQAEEDSTNKTNISHILFGIGGSVRTWKNRRHYTELWWKPNITRGFVWLDEKPDTWFATSPPYKVSENVDPKSAVRIARIVLESFKLGLKNVRWFVLGDDDTVFFPDNLISVLSKYDHNQMYYIGDNSESVEQDIAHSYKMAYGGGGFAISYRLAFELAQNLDDCIRRYSYMHGSDERIASCVGEIGVPLTKEVGFHQFDIRGDPYGLLAAHPLAPLVSLHHLDDVEPLFPKMTQLESVKMLMDIAYKRDPGRTLQQSVYYDSKRDWSVSVSWGYTVQIYPYFLSAQELCTPLQSFRTWSSRSENMFTFNVRPVKSDPCEGPFIFFLDKVVKLEGRRETVSTYKSYFGQIGMKCHHPKYAAAMKVKTVMVSASMMETGEWLKGPRRQCCEIRNGNSADEKENVIRIKIRKCHPRESFARN